MCVVRRVWTGLLLVSAAVVAIAVVYVVRQHPDIPRAGQAPGFSQPVESTPPTSRSTTTGPTTTAPTTTAPSPIRLAFLGDDYTASSGASSPKAGWTALVSAALEVDATTVSADGAGYAQTGSDGMSYQDLISQVVAANPQVVVVSGGRNDVTHSARQVRIAARKVFASLHTLLPDARLVAIAPWWGDSPHPPKLTKVDTAVQAGVEAVHGVYLDVADALSGHPNWMADLADPNDRGYRAIAASVTGPLQAQLPR